MNGWVFVLAVMIYDGFFPALFSPQRSDIVKATYEPTDEECEWKADEEQELTVSMQKDPERLSFYRCFSEHWICFLKGHSFQNCQVIDTLINVSFACEYAIFLKKILPVSKCLTVFLLLASLWGCVACFDQARFWWANVLTEPGWNEREGQGGRWEEGWGEGGPQRHPWILVNGFQKRGPSQWHVAGTYIHLMKIWEAVAPLCGQQIDLLPPTGQVTFSTEL